MDADSKDVTHYLERVAEGDREAIDFLFRQVYGDLRGLADRVFRNQPGSHTLQPTALVNEAYMRMVGNKGGLESRVHFLNLAATAMRQLLTDHARRKSASKRDGGLKRVALEPESAGSTSAQDVNLVDLDAALEKLQSVDARQAKIVELRFFGGLTYEEIAEVLGVSSRTARLDWKMASAWLREELKDD